MDTHSNKGRILSNTLATFKNIIAYDSHTLRIVFEHEGDEIVFINNGLSGLIHVYLNGNLAHTGWDWSAMLKSGGWFLHQGKTYKISSVVSNLITFSQNATLSINDEVVATKAGEVYGHRTPKDIAHLIFGGALLGVVVVTILKLIGV